MSSRLIIILLAVIVTTLLTFRGVDAEDKNNKNETEIVFHTPPILKNGIVSEYNTWLNLQPVRSEDSVNDDDIFFVMKRYPSLAPFSNAISNSIGLKYLDAFPTGTQFTIFAPVVSSSAYWNSMPDLKQVIQYHISTSEAYDLGSLDLEKKYLIGNNGPIVYKLESGHVRVDCTVIASKPIVASNGVIYPIHRPLSPSQGSVLRTALKAGRKSVC
jgi:uncharacterized surface protein with fasciclin (FAS1) repeats